MKISDNHNNIVCVCRIYGNMLFLLRDHTFFRACRFVLKKELYKWYFMQSFITRNYIITSLNDI